MASYSSQLPEQNEGLFTPVKSDVSDSELNAGGGQFDTTSEMNEGVPYDPMLLKVILKSIKVMIKCKKSDPYLKNSLRY